MKQSLLFALAVLLAPGLAAGQRDSVRQRGDTAEAEELRRMIEERFSARVQQELKLTTDQAGRLRATQEKFGTRRRALMLQQMQRRRALDDQMQPGVAANQDSVRKLMDGINAARLEMARIQQEENRELANFLTPVQQWRYNQMRERLLQRVGEMRRARQGRGMGPGGIRGKGPGPRRRGI